MHISAFAGMPCAPRIFARRSCSPSACSRSYRLGSVLPTPGVDYSAIQRCIDVSRTTPFTR